MKKELKKFGTLLLSRPNGREAFLAFQSQLITMDKNENLELDFEGVTTFTPSWGDEFLSPLASKYGPRLILLNTSNPSVKTTLEFLEKINQMRFNKSS